MYLEKLHIEKPLASSGIRTPNLPTLKQQCRTLHRNQLGDLFFVSTRSGAWMGKTMKSDEDSTAVDLIVTSVSSGAASYYRYFSKINPFYFKNFWPMFLIVEINQTFFCHCDKGDKSAPTPNTSFLLAYISLAH